MISLVLAEIHAEASRWSPVVRCRRRPADLGSWRPMLTTSSVSKRPVVTSLARWMLRKASRSFMSLLGSLGPRRGRPMASGERLAEFGRCSWANCSVPSRCRPTSHAAGNSGLASTAGPGRRRQRSISSRDCARMGRTTASTARWSCSAWRSAHHRPYEQIGRVTRAKQSPKWPDQMPASSPGWLRRMIVVRLCASMVNSVQDGEVRAGVQLCRRDNRHRSWLSQPGGMTRTSPSA